MYPLGHMVSETNSTVTSWCFPLADNRVIAPDAAAIARFPASFANIWLSFSYLLLHRLVHVFVRVSRRQREPVHGFAKAHDNLIRGDFRALHVHQSLDDRVRNLFTNFWSTARFRQPTSRDDETKRRQVVVVDSMRIVSLSMLSSSLSSSRRRRAVAINQ